MLIQPSCITAGFQKTLIKIGETLQMFTECLTDQHLLQDEYL